MKAPLAYTQIRNKFNCSLNLNQLDDRMKFNTKKYEMMN